VDIRNEVKRIIASQLKIPVELLKPGVRLKDLGAASLDFVEVLFELEEKFDISLPFNANQPAQRAGGGAGDESILLSSTIDQLADLIEHLVAKKETGVKS
jgi:acyl carrier protein